MPVLLSPPSNTPCSWRPTRSLRQHLGSPEITCLRLRLDNAAIQKILYLVDVDKKSLEHIPLKLAGGPCSMTNCSEYSPSFWRTHTHCPRWNWGKSDIILPAAPTWRAPPAEGQGILSITLSGGRYYLQNVQRDTTHLAGLIEPSCFERHAHGRSTRSASIHAPSLSRWKEPVLTFLLEVCAYTNYNHLEPA